MMYLFQLFGHLTMSLILSFFGEAHQSDTLTDQVRPIYPFRQGERIEYKMNYSIFTVGKAEINVNPVTYMINDKSCFKIDIYGRTAGAAAIVTTVNDTWGAYLDKNTLLPVKTWRNLEEGRYRRKELVDYHHAEGKVNVHELDYYSGKLTESNEYTFEKEPFVHDLISGFTWLRSLNYDHLTTSDTIRVYGFLEDKFYKFNIMYMGIEEVKTKLGRIMAHKLVPVMPDNSIFAGENSITAWISADDAKVPIMIEAKMFIGSASCEITGFEGLKKKPIFIID